MARKTALITGAGRNIGRACALGLAQDGYNVVINGSSNRAACEKVAQEATAQGVEALVAMGDVGDPKDAARIAFEAIARFGAVDVLVNNAAIRPGKSFLETSDEDWRRVMSVDLDAAVWLARACLPKMLERGWGRIVNFTGMNAMQGTGGRWRSGGGGCYNRPPPECTQLRRMSQRAPFSQRFPLRRM